MQIYSCVLVEERGGKKNKRLIMETAPPPMGLPPRAESGGYAAVEAGQAGLAGRVERSGGLVRARAVPASYCDDDGEEECVVE